MLVVGEEGRGGDGGQGGGTGGGFKACGHNTS